ncbi:hypothetical protein PTKIN_Ptkin17bG0112800 [Pterospermum kingtungense]
MAQISKVEAQTEIRLSADKFYDIFRNKIYLLPKICTQEFKDGKLLQGDWNSVGCVREWSYTAAGNTETVRETIEANDDQNKAITFNMLNGDAMKYYNSYKPNINVTAAGRGSLVKWTIE